MNIRWIDTHVHMDRYEASDRDAIIERAAAAGVAVVSIGVDIDSSRAAVALRGTAGAAVGVHPRYSGPVELDTLAGLLSSRNVVAVGECGFDAGGPVMAVQLAAFQAQADLAKSFRLPLVLHIDGPGAFEALRVHGGMLDGLTVVRHYFTGGQAEADWHGERGHYLAFGNPLRREPELQEVARAYPEDLLLVETDSYPIPGRRTEPKEVANIGETLGAIRGWKVAEASERLLANTRAAFPRVQV